MFTPNAADGYKEVFDKIQMKTMVYGEKTLMVEFHLAKGADLPAAEAAYREILSLPIFPRTSILMSRPATWFPVGSI